MVDTPISSLPAAASALGPMQLEVNDSGVSRSITNTQVGAFVKPTTVNPSFSASEIQTRMENGGEIIFAPGNYDLSSIPNGTLLNSALRLTGPGRDLATITLGGTPQAFIERFVLRNSLYMTGLTWVNGGELFSVQGLLGTIAEIEIRDCGFDNIQSALFHDDTAPSATARIDWIDFSGNVVTNCNSGVHLRGGLGGASNVLLVERGRFNNNRLETIDKYGIVVNYDNPQTPSYTLESYAEAIGNTLIDVQGRSGSTATGFGVNLTAYKRWSVTDGYFFDFQKGDRTALEPVYSKSLSTSVSDCWFIDCHDEEGGGAVSNKADDNGQIAELFEVSDCHFINSDSANKRMRYGVWVEGSNTRIQNCEFRGAMRGCIVTAGASTKSGLTVQGCVASLNDCGGSESGVPYRALSFVAVNRNLTFGVVVQSNVVTALDGSVGGGSPFRAITLDLDSGETLLDPLIKGNTVRKDSAMTNLAVAVFLNKDAGGTLQEAQIVENYFDGVDFAIQLVGTALDGTTRIRKNDETGVGTDVDNQSASTVDEALNSWNP